MKSVVTGGAGFIGSNLVDRLVQKGHKVIVLDNFSTGRRSNLSHHKKKDVKIIKMDISKNKKLYKYFKNVDYVFHLAGLADIVPSITNPSDYFQTNVKGTLNILEASKKANIKKLIYAASASCYGISDKYPTTEKAKIKLLHPYALTKFLGEKLTIHWAELYDMPNVSLRFFNIYGPRLRSSGPYSSVFNIFLKQKIKKKPLTIVGDGNQTRDFIHVYDTVDAIIKSAKKSKKGKIYNIGFGKETTVNYIADMFGGNKINISKIDNEPKRSVADITKIKKELNWKPKITIEKGIEMLLKNISSWKEAKIWTPKKIKEETKT